MLIKGNLIRKQDFDNKRRHQTRQLHIKEKSTEIPERYENDIKLFINYCSMTEQEINSESMLDYLYVSLVEEAIKKNTWERRLAAVKKFLSVKYDVDFLKEVEFLKEIKVMRDFYKEEQYSDLIQVKGKSPVNKDELLDNIRELPIRAKSICFVNLITANRPNEMTRMKIKDFDLEASFVSVFLRKQRVWHNKRLTQESIKFVREYIRKYKLKADDYFVGRVYKNGRYESTQISETAYRNSLKKWTGLTGYNFRKTQVVSMHEAGADLPTIAKQTGHRSLETITKHYLEVTDSTVDKFL